MHHLSYFLALLPPAMFCPGRNAVSMSMLSKRHLRKGVRKIKEERSSYEFSVKKLVTSSSGNASPCIKPGDPTFCSLVDGNL